MESIVKFVGDEGSTKVSVTANFILVGTFSLHEHDV